MRTIDIIRKKRDGETLSDAEIRFFVDGYTAGEIPDYQASAFLMACFLRGLNDGETVALTEAMLHSGDTVSLDFAHTVDKHSTGGVGDGVSLALAPIVAACGGKVAMMSGRGLGHTGGTLDKLEAIEGYRTRLSEAEFKAVIRAAGASIIGQTDRLAPADKKLYALRDATGTVESLPLITASILSKKLAEGVQALVLDVKTGSGAFLSDEAESIRLAETMVRIAKRAGKRVVALVTDMDRPLGNVVGNSLEVIEAIDCLHGAAPADYTELTLTLAAEMLALAGCGEIGACRARAEEAVASGKAFSAFREMVRLQGGRVDWIDEPDRFPKARFEHAVRSEQTGYLTAIDTRRFGEAAVLLGAGRNKKEDRIDFAAGIRIHKKTGDFVSAGERIATLYASDEALFAASEQTLSASLSFGAEPPAPRNLVRARIV